MILGCVDISIDSKELYEQLLELHRTEFGAEDVIILEYNADEFDYEGKPGKRLTKAIEFLNKIDIPLFFVQISTEYENIVGDLSQLNAEIKTIKSNVAFNYQSATARNSFCILPWIHLYVGPDGNVLPCCIADITEPIGNIDTASVQSIISSDRAVQLRKNMLSGKKCSECKSCYVREDAGLPSARIRANTLWAKYFTIANDAEIRNFSPKYLDIRISNLCNLKCRMCSDYYSSSIAQENKQIYGQSNKIIKIEKTAALENIRPYLESAEKIYFAGGEPLLMAEHYAILDTLIELGNTDLEIVYTTNFTNLEFKNCSVLELWHKFSNVTVGASLDAEGTAAEYLRHGTVWTDIEHNRRQLSELCPQVGFTVNSIVHMLNVESLIELQRNWADVRFTMIPLISPDHMSLTALPEHHKNRLASLIDNHISWLKVQGAILLADEWRETVKYMFSSNSSHLLKEFQRVTAELDDRRKESFITVFPQYKDLLDV